MLNYVHVLHARLNHTIQVFVSFVIQVLCWVSIDISLPKLTLFLSLLFQIKRVTDLFSSIGAVSTASKWRHRVKGRVCIFLFYFPNSNTIIVFDRIDINYLKNVLYKLMASVKIFACMLST